MTAPIRELSTRDLAEVSGGHLVFGAHGPLGPVSIDTRTLAAGQAFFCIRGPRFDGHAFIDEALARGARVVVVDQQGVERLRGRDPRGATVIAVPDTVEALGAVAALHRRRFEGAVVGLTGSSGKTTTKELVAAVLRAAGPTLATAGNLNNHLGVPLTLLRLTGEHRFAVIEMGMNAPGEIAWLGTLAAPRIGVITTVGPAHLQGLGTVEAVAAAKGELFGALPPDGLAVMPSDIAFPWRVTMGLRAPLLLVGERPEDEVRLVKAQATADGAAGTVEVDGERHRLTLRMAGTHNLHNALLAVAVGRALGVPPAAAVAALAEVPPPSMRGELRRLPDGTEVVLDCYNANPQSMAAAVRTFAQRAPDGVLVLGDMLELGAGAAADHEAIGRLVAGLPGHPLLVGVGPLAAALVEGARAAGLPADRCHLTRDAEEAAALLRTVRGEGRPILLKGSRGIRLERIFDALARAERN